MGLYRTGMSSGGSITIDDQLSTTSENPVQNKVITNALNDKQNGLTTGNGISIDSSTNTISINASTSGLQKFIDQDALTPSGSGSAGYLTFKGANGNSNKDLYRYDESNGWTKVDFVSSHFTISTTDLGEGQPLDAGQFWIVVE